MENDILNNIWPEWQIVRRIGRGSFGIVYEAVRTDHLVESRAAIKVISIPQDKSEIDSLRSEGLSKEATRTYLQGVVNDFVSEIQLMESFKGVQNIVSVEDYKVIEKKDKIGWDIYIRMELLTPFNTYICDKTLSENEIIKLGVDICSALELCAKRNVIHRDIKPENIFINQFGDFKLGDFGIARKLENLTGGLSQKGTYNYMAPEIEKGNRYDATVDLYSLGLVLYRLLNKNRLPFLDTERQLLNPNERMAAIRRRMDGEPLPSPCDASPAMAQVILCACDPDPNKRFSSATTMKNALVSIANGTHAGIEDTLDKTTPVRKATQAQDPDKTMSVRKAPQAQRATQMTIGTFGRKKKTKIPVIIAIFLVTALLIGCSVFVLPKLLGNSVSNSSDDSDDSVTDTYSDFNEESGSGNSDNTEDGDYDLHGLNENGKFNTLDDFVNSSIMQDQLDEQVSSLEDAGISCEITAEGEKLVYSYTLVDDSITSSVDMTALKESLDSSLEEQADVFTGVAASLPAAVEGMENPVVVVRYLDNTGAEITSREFPAE